LRANSGEWIAADGSLPFDLSGWISAGLGREYDGTLTRAGVRMEACEAAPRLTPSHLRKDSPALPLPRRTSTPWRLSAAALAMAMLACARQGIVLPGEGTPLPTIRTATYTPTQAPSSATPLASTATPAAQETATEIWTLVPPSSPTFPATPTQVATASLPIVYRVQAGDTLNTLAIRFGVTPEEIRAMEGNPPPLGLLNPGLQLVIPARLGPTTPADEVMPDSEVVFSASAAAFDVAGFARDRRGYLSHAQTENGTGSAPATLKRLALDNSVSPRLLLALLEHFGGWVTKASPSGDALSYPFGVYEAAEAGFSSQLIQATNRLGIGYYGWRDASLLELVFRDGTRLRLAPALNAGTVAVLYYFSVDATNESDWRADVQAFLATYRSLFDDPFARVDRFEPLYYPTLTRPNSTCLSSSANAGRSRAGRMAPGNAMARARRWISPRPQASAAARSRTCG
jgi:LysM repeat protein